jgi:hypothetical protein
LSRIWPEVICWLGQPGERYQQYAIDEGLLADTVETLRQKFLRRVGPLLTELGYDLSIAYDKAANQWRLTADLPWDRWDPKTRRLSS